ncbi:MAG: murein transglycosylase A [Chakrabartia sp.]
MRRRALFLILGLALAGCTTHRPNAVPAPAPLPTPAPVAPAPAATAVEAGVAQGPDIAALGLDAAAATRALQAFRLSCPALMRRADSSGLTRAEEWRPACEAAAAAPDEAAVAFFARHLASVQIGTGKALATGYYEPELAGSRVQSPAYPVPIYKRPPDMIEADLGLFSDALAGKRVRGRVIGKNFVPYADRAEIEAGWLAGRGLELAWAADPIEFFFLQVQGSGRVRLPDGRILRIGYDGQNGRAYTAIGKVMRDKGLIGAGEASMDGIIAWLRAHPDQAPDILNANKSWVFFKEVTGPGPLGAMGVPVTGRATVAADPKFVPLGAPIILKTAPEVASGLWVAQDTGGAIKGANRFDTFWGAGPDARQTASGLIARGTAYLLLPKASVARLLAGGGRADQTAQP